MMKIGSYEVPDYLFKPFIAVMISKATQINYINVKHECDSHNK